VIATAVPISERGICMIQGCLEEVKIGGKAQWWFSTSQSGGFRPDAGINAKELRKSKTSLRRHGEKAKKIGRLARTAKIVELEILTTLDFFDQCHH